jgi:hypothetical protein
MGTADDFLSSFLKQYPQAANGNLSMEELNNLMAEYQRKMNSEPLDDFDGLSPEEMTVLLHAPFTPGAILQFGKGMEDHLDKVPIFKLSELLLAEIRNAGTLKLTPKGNLPVRICELLYHQDLIKWKYQVYVKKVTEDEIPYLWPLKQHLLNQGIVKKRNNALSLTKLGEKFMGDTKTIRFTSLLNYFTSSFHWGNFHGLQDDGKCGNLGWAYSLVLLSKYGGKPEKSEFYSFKLIRAFEQELWNAHQNLLELKAIEDHHHAYEARFFECFANWFGLVNIERERSLNMSFIDQLTITKSPLFDRLYEVTKVH